MTHSARTSINPLGGKPALHSAGPPLPQLAFLNLCSEKRGLHDAAECRPTALSHKTHLRRPPDNQPPADTCQQPTWRAGTQCSALQSSQAKSNSVKLAKPLVCSKLCLSDTPAHKDGAHKETQAMAVRPERPVTTAVWQASASRSQT